MKLTWSTSARQDLIHIRHYIARFHPAAASKVARSILEAVEPLCRHGELGSPTKLPNVRRLVVRNAPYIIYYRLSSETVEILEVFDARRAAPKSLGTTE